MSPWVRIDENALEHPKIAALSHGAVVLWVQGLAYCQKFLTDGVICLLALKGLRAYSVKRRAELLSARLWDEVPDGIRVHDFLDWNESKDRVLTARELARDRKRRLRGSPRGTPSERTQDTPVGGFVSGVGSSGKGSAEGKPNGRALGLHEPSPANVPEELSERAGHFVREVYPALYREFRNGAHYVGKPNLDYLEALQLCQVWDDARLKTLAISFLTTDHKFADKSSGTLAQFRSMASWCDKELRQQGL